MQPGWLRAESMRAWRANTGAGCTSNSAMVVCDALGLKLPTEVWMEVCEWLVATRALELMHRQLDALKGKIEHYNWWMSKRELSAHRLLNEVDGADREPLVAAMIHSRSRAITIGFRIKFLIAESAAWCTRLGYSELHRFVVDGLAFEN